MTYYSVNPMTGTIPAMDDYNMYGPWYQCTKSECGSITDKPTFTKVEEKEVSTCPKCGCVTYRK
jgi:hypothetical protein